MSRAHFGGVGHDAPFVDGGPRHIEQAYQHPGSFTVWSLMERTRE